MAIDVGTPGYAIDITVASFKFDGETLSAAITEADWNSKTSEEILHMQGVQDPIERTKGQRDHSGTMSWGARQYALFCRQAGGWDAVKNKEFSLVLQCEPDNDPHIYTHTFTKLRLHSDSNAVNKSAGVAKIEFSFLEYDLEVEDI